MAKKLLFSLLLGVLVLSAFSLASAYTIRDGKLIEEWQPAAGWTVTFDVYRPCTCGYFSALGTFGAGDAIATKYNFVNACSLIDLQEVTWTDPGDGINMVVTPCLWADDPMNPGLPLDPPLWVGDTVSMPTAGIYRMTLDMYGAYVPGAGVYHLGLKMDSTATGWTGYWWGMEHANAHNPVDPLNLSTYGMDSDADGYPDFWMTNEDLGFDYRWYMRAHGIYDQPTEQVYIPSGIMGPQGMTVNVPVYGEFADPEDVDGISFAVWVDGVDLTLDATPFIYTTTDPTYTCLSDVIAFGDLFFWGPYVTATLDSATLGITGDMMGANDWDSPGVYKLFDLIVHVSPTAPMGYTYPIHIENILGLNNSFTHATTDFYPVLISGSIFVPTHVMFGVTFAPDTASVDEGDCTDVEVFGGCTVSGDDHVLTVVDEGGTAGFMTFVQDGFKGDDTHGVLTFCPGCCDDGTYYIEVEDHCTTTDLYEYATLELTVANVMFDPYKLSLNCGETIEVWPGADIDVPVDIYTCDEEIGGYNLLIEYDMSVLTLTGVEDKMGFEYFYWTEYQVDRWNKIHIVGIANKPNQVDTDPIPGCLVKEPIVDLYFHVSAKWDPNYATPISFEVDDPCVDNTMSNELGTKFYQAKENWKWVADHMEGVSVAFCGGDAIKAYKLFGTQVRGVELDGPYGDVNCDGIPYTIADAVFFMEYLKGADVELCDWSATASDINRDGHQWTIADLIMLVNILNGSANPVGEGKVLASTANITVGNTISTDAEIGGIYLTVKGGGEPVLNAAGMDMETSLINGERRIIIMSWDSNVATGDLVTIPGSFEVTSVEVSDPAGYLMKVSTVPSEFALAQNYPNPFNPNTNISFSLPNDANVSLTVYNITGEKVAELVNGQVKAGQHTVSWNASNVGSGVYFYRINAGNFTATRKMVLMK